MLKRLRHHLRALFRSPGYALVTILVLAMGTGAGVAALAVGQRALFAPLPYEQPDRLVVVFEATPQGGMRLASFPTVQDWTSQSRTLTSISYVTGTQQLLRRAEGHELVTVAYAAGPFFPLLGAQPVLGRFFTDADSTGAPVVVLSHSLWQSRFGGRSDIIGKEVPLGAGATVIGVMPRGVAFPEWGEAWMPIHTASPSILQMMRLRGNHADSRVVARLRDGATLEQAQTEMNTIATRLAESWPEDSRDFTRTTFVPLQSYGRSFTNAGANQDLTSRLGLVAGAAALILLLGCANVAVMGLVRGFSRSRELAIRAAIGARRGQIVRSVLAENITLAALGGVLGIGLGYTIVRVVQRVNPDLFPRFEEIHFDATFLIGGLVLSLFVGVLSGILPALAATPLSLSAVFGSTRGAGGGGRSGSRLQRALIAGQVALAVLLLIGAGLFLKSLNAVMQTTVGFDVERLSYATINPPGEKYAAPQRTQLLYQSLIDAVRRVPGVRDVAFVNHVPIGGGWLPTRVEVIGSTPTTDGSNVANFKTITPNYFSVAGIPVVRGRAFTQADVDAPAGGIVVNQRFAERWWPGADPIGKPLTVFRSARWLPQFGQPMQGHVIGVVGDVRHYGQEADPPTEVYVPWTSDLWQWGNLVIRHSGEVGSIRDGVQRAMLGVEPDLPLGGRAQLASFGDRLGTLQSPRRLMTASLATLAVAALAITMVGLYASLAWAVRRRRSELGIRFALGATRGEVVGLVMREGLGITLIGLVVGLIAAWLGANLLRTLVFGISTRDVGVFAAACVPLVVAATFAAYMPARQAAGVDPIEALRDG